MVSVKLGALSAGRRAGCGCGLMEGSARLSSLVLRVLCSAASIAVEKRWGQKLKSVLGVFGDRRSSCVARCQGVSRWRWGGERAGLWMLSHGLRKRR